LQCLELGAVLLAAAVGVPDARQTCARNQADVTTTDDCNVHNKSLTQVSARTVEYSRKTRQSHKSDRTGPRAFQDAGSENLPDRVMTERRGRISDHGIGLSERVLLPR